MKTIYNIAKTELKTLFYSPIAWIILAIFALQANMTYFEILATYVKYQLTGYNMSNFTTKLFTNDGHGWSKAVFPSVQEYLYLYIPLLTMGIMSREISSGSLKLLMSSPVTSRQIIFGKFLSMVIYGLALIAVLLLTVIFSLFVVKDFDLNYVFSGLLGLFLLLCAYSAIGIFMSSLTSYQVVAAMGTLALLALLNYVGQVGQGIEFVRDITYWLSISGRAKEMVAGLLSSDDVLYFIIVISLFISFSIIKLQAGKTKNLLKVAGKYVLVVVVCLFIGYITSRPSAIFYVDATRTNHRTLTPNSQEIVKKLEGGLTITTFVNILDEKYHYGKPDRVNDDMKRFQQYIRFKPETKMKYVYYWDKADNPRLYKRYPNMSDGEIAEKVCDINDFDFKRFLSPAQVKKIADLAPENNRFVRLIERENGNSTFLRIYDDMFVHPSESEISAALKRLAMELPKVGFITGHDERDILTSGDRDYSNPAYSKTFRNSLINQGFEAESINLSEADVPDDINIIVVADMKSEFTETEYERLDNYLKSGRNILIAAEPRRREEMAPLVSRFGVSFIEGIMVQTDHDFIPSLIINEIDKKAQEKVSYIFKNAVRRRQKVTMPGAMGLDFSLAESKGFQVSQILSTKDSCCWNETETTDFIDGELTLGPDKNETEKSTPTAIALSREIAGKNQRIVILGDADCISNGEISASRNNIKAANFTFFTGLFEYLSEGKAPIDTRRPDFIDDEFYISQNWLKFWNFIYLWVVPLGLVVICFFIWIIRRKK